MADRDLLSSHAASEHQRTQDLLTQARMREQRRSREPEGLPACDAPAGGQPDSFSDTDLSRSILEASADCIKVLTFGGTLQSMNERGRCLLELDDFDQVKGLPWIEFWSHDQRPAVQEALNAARSGGVGRFSGYRPTAKGAPKWWDVIVTPMRDASGSPTHLVAISRDVTQAQHHAQAGDLLNLELAHRVKNLFALVNGLITVAARAEPASRSFAETLRERFTALSRALDYILPSQKVANSASERTLQGLLRALLDPYEEFDRHRRRFVILGDDPPVGPNATTSLALSVHELATNAVKYGALFSPEGRVTITCRCTAADECELTWVERGGPVVGAKPERTGFGSKLLMRSITGALGGQVSQQWRREGLAVRLVLPLMPLTQ
jgi:PAS domain S-box-containing protein